MPLLEFADGVKVLLSANYRRFVASFGSLQQNRRTVEDVMHLLLVPTSKQDSTQFHKKKAWQES